MSRIKDVHPKVEFILQHYPVARNDDKFLIKMVYSMCYGIDCRTPFGSVLDMKDLPSFESIRRARQKIQEMNPELRGTKEVEDIRLAEQEDYIEYAKEGA